MKSIHRTLQRLALAALTATAFLSQAEATPVVSISPATQNIGVGAPGSINIIVSGLTVPAGGFSLTLAFNNSFLSGVSFFNDPGGKMGAFPLDLSGGFLGGSLDLYFAADATSTLAGLTTSEGASFTLATVNFLGAASGLSPLTLSKVVLSNFDGTAGLAGVTSTNGQICVGAGDCAINPVPEPETYLLFAAGLAVLAMRRRRAK